jgi:hypothetical protein
MMNKLLLLTSLFVSSASGMTDGACGSVKSSDWNSPNDVIARLNGACKISHEDCPYKCKTFYTHLMVESMKQLIEDLYNDNMIDLEIMEKELLSLINEKNADMINQVIEKIQSLKE